MPDLAKYGISIIFALVSSHSNAQSKKPTLILPSNVVDRSGSVPVIFRFDHGMTGRGELRIRWTDSIGRAVQDETGHVDFHEESEHGHTGQGELKIHWTDSLGRVVQDEVRPIVLNDETEISFSIDLSRAVAMKNTLQVRLLLKETTPIGKVSVEEEAATDFVARPPDGWKDYAIIMYQQYPSAIQPALNQIGINAGQYPGNSRSQPDYLIDNNMRWYSEQIGTDFYAEYHRWRPDRPVNWSFLHAKEIYASDPSSKEAFKRNPSLWDPVWRTKIHDRIVDVTKRNFPYRPLFYSLSDESGLADLGAQWDFDFSEYSLVPMRRWLRGRYGNLDALNTEWGTKFTDWNLVSPSTTDEAMQRKGENFSSWADFKEWMDISYADALQMGVDAAHEVDPKAFVGIVGAQKPGWGGYDYSRLSRVVTTMEPYDIGGSVKLVHSLNPTMPLLTTTFAAGDWEKHRVWFELLQGERGLILWDDTQRYILPDGSTGPAGKNAESYYNEIRNGIGALIINSVCHDDKIAIHYSQPSMRTEWMLERRPDGNAWMKRDAQYERTHNDFLRLRESWGHAIEDQGQQYSFVSYTQVEEGELQRHGYHMLILPHSSSLSRAETKNIRNFVDSGGVVVADGMPGTFDEHSRRLDSSSLADLFPGQHNEPLTITKIGNGKTIFVKANMLAYLQERLNGKESASYKLTSHVLNNGSLPLEVTATDDSGKFIVGLIVHMFSNGGVQLLSLQSNPQQSVNELGPANFLSNKRFEKTQTVHIHLSSASHIYDLRQKKYLGREQEFSVSVDPYEPTILALSASAPARLQVSIPAEANLGTVVPISLRLDGTSSNVQVYHVDVLDPAGRKLLQYTGNVIASGGAALKEIPLALNDPAGKWTIHVQDMLTGNIETRTVNVR